MSFSLDQRSSSSRDPGALEAPSSVDRVAQAASIPEEKRPTRCSNGLTPREAEVMNHLLEGASYKTIAVAMNLSVHTVHDYVKAIFRELEVTSKGELLARFRAPAA